MCTGCIPEGITVCPHCKRDDEAYRLGEGDSPFADLGGGRLKCRCGHIFAVAHALAGEAEDAGRTAAI